MSCNGARSKARNHVTCTNDGNSEDQNIKTKRTTERDACNRQLSVRLYDVLDHVGASADFRKFRQDFSLSREILMALHPRTRKRSVSANYIFGSTTEGTTIPSLNSDFDWLACIDIPVVANISEAEDGHSFLMIRDTHTPAGYVKLQRVHNRRPQTVNTRKVNQEGEEYDSKGRICFKHISFLGENDLIDSRNGPADTNNYEDMDNVYGLKCSTIPKYAREWIGRHRDYKWPPKRMLDTMKTMECFVVGVGHPASKEKHLEWRLSFSLQERKLMFSMNMTQYKCYVILKIIKKDLIEPIVGKTISSYHMKTCMFHAIENTMLSFWKRINMVHCVMLCMHILFKWVYIGYCPNYFITEENMFDRDIHRHQRLNLLQQIRFLLSHGNSFLFFIKLDNIGMLLKKSTSNLQTASNLNLARLGQKHLLIQDVIYFRNALCCQDYVHVNARTAITMILKYVTQTKSVKDHTDQQKQKAISYILPYINLHLSQSFASLAFNTHNGEDKIILLQASGHYLRQGRHCDMTSTVLLEATVYLKLELYERCIGILDQLELKLKQTSLIICTCNTRRHSFSKEQIRQLNNLPVSDIVRRTSTCVLFHRSDISITPEALKFEMFRSINTQPGSRHKYGDTWYDMAVVDAVVYLHFLQYLVNAKLNKRIQKHVAIHKLESSLKCEPNLGHYETGYNLLGWIHFNGNWIPRGLKYFQKSWAIQPHHNAAKLHILKLIRDINHHI